MPELWASPKCCCSVFSTRSPRLKSPTILVPDPGSRTDCNGEVTLHSGYPYLCRSRYPDFFTSARSSKFLHSLDHPSRSSADSRRVADLDTGSSANMTMGEKLPYACGGIVVAGLLYLVLALIVQLVGVKRVMHFLPPVVTGPIITLHRPEPGAFGGQQRFHELDSGDHCAGRLLFSSTSGAKACCALSRFFSVLRFPMRRL